jgi:hypothetical protein
LFESGTVALAGADQRVDQPRSACVFDILDILLNRHWLRIWRFQA